MIEPDNEKNEYVLVVGTDESYMRQEQFMEMVTEICVSCKDKIEKTNGLMFIFKLEEPQVVVNMIENLLEYCEQQNRKEITANFFCIFISVAYGKKNELKHVLVAKDLFDDLKKDAQRRKAANQDVSSSVLITTKVFNHLDWQQQYLYSSSIEKKSIKVHRRFDSSLLRCFVISPIGKEGGSIQTRANHVFDTYIKTACDGTDYRPVRGDAMTGPNVLDDIILALQTDPMVIAYLGNPNPEWNPNVMLEIGARLQTNMPIVCLRDAPVEGEEEKPLPFDLLNQRVIYIPSESLSRDTEDEGDIIATKIRTIREMIKEAGEAEAWQYPYACATIVIDRDGTDHRFIESSKELEKLFEMKNIIGAKLDQVIDHLIHKMPEGQRQPFIKEQERLIADITSPTLFKQSIIKDVSASIPVVFEHHKIFSKKAFLPIIVRYRMTKEFLKITVLYIDVSSICEKSDIGHYVCSFGKRKEALLEI
jgi:hypothetical protein